MKENSFCIHLLWFFMFLLSFPTVLSFCLGTSVYTLDLRQCFIHLLGFLVQIKQPQTHTGAELC